jgi:hypothetical protein
MFNHLENPRARQKLLSYVLNRLDNGQIRDVLDLLDTDPEHQGAAEHVRQPARKRSR